MLYFAYGSNMDPTQIRRRCPSHRFISIAKLENHKLAFTRRSQRRRCGVADVIAHSDQVVWGVLYTIDSKRDIARLDEAEGYRKNRQYGNAYDREIRQFWTPNSPHKPITANIYIAKKQLSPPPPSDHYLSLMITGARHWKLPGDYITQIIQIRQSQNVNLA